MTDQGKRHVIVCYTPRVSMLWPSGPTHLIRRAVEERLRNLGVSLMIFCFFFYLNVFISIFIFLHIKLLFSPSIAFYRFLTLKESIPEIHNKKKLIFFYFLGLTELYENGFFFLWSLPSSPLSLST